MRLFAAAGTNITDGSERSIDMKTDIIVIDETGKGIETALLQAEQAARYRGLNEKNSLQLQIMTEEIMGLARGITGETTADFWLESEGTAFSLHLTTRTKMDASKRYLLMYSSTSGKNEAAKGFIGYLRDKFENALLAESDGVYYDFNSRARDEAPQDEEWDRYERSILRKLADEIRIGVKGGLVEIEVRKTF